MQRFATVVATTAVVGYDILKDVTWRRESYGRRLVALGFTGSAAAGDTQAELFINGVKLADLINLNTGWPSKDYIMPCAIPVPANALLEIKITDAPTTNPINVVAVFVP